MSIFSGNKLNLVVGTGTSADIQGPNWIFDFSKETGFEASNPFDVSFELSVEIGVEGSGEFDWFSCIVSTNRAAVAKEGKVIFLECYTFLNLKKEILRIVEKCEAENWYYCLVGLRKHFKWEYDGMYSEDELRRLNS
ncbi:Imm8 family immunity protein [Sinorhizobium meliloti]|uniref:Imm8 family immunity protein n=1 Tax=Rhizobium meliloti TaxID=382 RepID=UPI00138ABF26|nr:Imm8 family immunity protein [Sinorhizobium meliloti]